MASFPELLPGARRRGVRTTWQEGENKPTLKTFQVQESIFTAMWTELPMARFACMANKKQKSSLSTHKKCRREMFFGDRSLAIGIWQSPV